MTEALLEAPTTQPEAHDAHPLPWVALHNGLRKFTVDEYETLVRHGILAKDDRVELIEGYLVLKMTLHPPHVFALNKLRKRLDRVLPERWNSHIQSPIRLSDSEPEPDYSVFRGDDTEFESRHPRPHEIGLVVEVADSSLHGDRTDKARIYARNSLAEYWIVNLVESQIEVYTEPQAETPHYFTRVVYKFGDKVPFRLDGKLLTEIAVEEVFPRPNPVAGGE